jgi:thiol-disulfide isomerase/thioredoxin
MSRFLIAVAGWCIFFHSVMSAEPPQKVQPESKSKTDVLYERALAIALSNEMAPERDMAIEQFIQSAPKDDRGPYLLTLAADKCEEQAAKLKIFNRIITDYAGTYSALSAAGSIRRIEGVGKRFELEFTDAISGKLVSMKDFAGKVVVIDFWATWCGPCIAEMPKKKEIYSKYKARGVEFIGVSLDIPESKGGLDKLKAFVNDNDIPWPQLYQGKGWKSEFSTSWGVNFVPTLFIIDADGKLHSTDARLKLDSLIPELLKKRDG